MPVYEYFCGTCGRTFEMVRPMAESEFDGRCVCGESARRILSATQAPIIKDPRLPTAKAERVPFKPSTPPAEVYTMDFGKSERNKLESLAQVRG